MKNKNLFLTLIIAVLVCCINVKQDRPSVATPVLPPHFIHKHMTVMFFRKLEHVAGLAFKRLKQPYPVKSV
jgi:hypothetical protein